MTDAASPDDEGILQPKQQSLLRSSALMASGTLVSRLLGFIRSALLIAALGSTAGAAAAFQVANTLPNTVYNLLAAGILDAILVPQIIRALRRRGGSEYLNKLITLAGTILFGITVLTMIGAPLLISITSAKYGGSIRALAITFALWCLPQIFFYGVYNLFGEILNARGVFGPYMWAPVVNNIVGIAGLGAFLMTWGPSGETLPAEGFTSAQIWVIAGSATLGVIAQALCLVIPLRASGVKLRLDFHFRGTDFGSASKVAGWTFATLMVSQLGVLSTSNLNGAADMWSEGTGVAVAGTPAYNMSFMIYMVPQSLIAVTLATAIFTRLANNVANRNFKAVAQDYHTGVRLITMLSMLAVAVLMAGAVPMMQMVMPSQGPEAAAIYAPVLIALLLGVPSTGIVIISQRVFFAFEDAKPVFLMGIVPTALQLIVGWTIYFTADAQWWTIGAAAAETVCRVVQGFIAIIWTAKRVRAISAGRLIASYLLYFFAFIGSAVCGWLLLRLVSPSSTSSGTLARFFGASWRLAMVAVVVTVIFLLILRLLDPEGSRAVTEQIRERLGKGPSTPANEPTPASGVTDENLEEPEALTSQLQTISDAGINAYAAGALTPPPSWEEIMAEEQAHQTLSRAMGSQDPTATGSFPRPITPTRAPQTEYDVNQSPHARGSALTPTSTLQSSDNRFNPTAISLVFGAVLVVIALIFAVRTLGAPAGDSLLGAIEQSESQQSQQSGSQSGEEPAPPGPEAGTPVISAIEVFSWNDDGSDHPELSGALTDGDPETLWYSRYYDANQFSEDNTVSLLVNFTEEAKVSEVVLDFIGGSGEGEVVLRAAQDGNPRAGDILATAAITERTVIKLPEPATLSSLGINFTRMPIDDEGVPRAKVSSLAIN